MNNLEVNLVIIFMTISFIFFYLCLKNIKRSAINAVIGAPALYINLNFLTQIITADESKYIISFSDMATSLATQTRSGVFFSLYQYRTTQFLVGSVMRFFKPMEDTYLLYQRYKIVHWIFCFFIIWSILVVAYRYLLNNNATENQRQITLLLQYICCFSIPVSAWIVKVGNYDAFSIFFSILAICFSLGCLKTNKEWLGIMGIICSTLGAIEKTAATPYFSICAVLYIVYILNRLQEQNMIEKVKGVGIGFLKMIGVAIATSGGILLYILFLTDPEYANEVTLSLGDIVFPFIYYIYALKIGTFSYAEFKIEHPWPYISLLLFLILICSVVLHYWYIQFQKDRKILTISSDKIIRFIPKLNTFIIAFLIVISFYATYFIPTQMDYLPIEDGMYGFGTNLRYHYSSKNWFSHIISFTATHYATVANAIPTILLLAFIVYGIFAFMNAYETSSIPLHLSVLTLSVLPLFYALGGQPTVSARYYGTVIIGGCFFLLVIICNQWILWSQQKNAQKAHVSYASSKNKKKGKQKTKVHFAALKDKKRKKRYAHSRIWCGILVCVLFWYSEIFIFSPNICVFFPIWNIPPASLNQSPTHGVIRDGEAMMWGEDIALSGSQIYDHIRLRGKSPEEITIYSDYGQIWIDNPGFEIIFAPKHTDGFTFDENSYYSFSRFRLFRKEIPPFITEVQPFDSVSYRGMIAVWIYRGDQLADYEDSLRW